MPRPAGPRPAAGRHAGFANLLRAEWTKIRSVRSTVWTLVIFVVVCIGFTALITWLTETHWYGPKAAPRDIRAIADPVGFILGTGVGLGQLAIGVLGVLVITSEYSTGVIRASLLAVPRRLPVLAAKAVVFAVLLLVVTEIVAFCSFFVGSAILHAHVQVSLSGSGVTRAVVGAGLYLTVLGLLALAIGTMIRHTAGAISTIIGVVFVLPILSGLLPSSWGAHINAYLPEQAGTLITHTQEQSGDLLSPGRGSGCCASGRCWRWPRPPTCSSAATPEPPGDPFDAGQVRGAAVQRLTGNGVSPGRSAQAAGKEPDPQRRQPRRQQGHLHDDPRREPGHVGVPAHHLRVGEHVGAADIEAAADLSRQRGTADQVTQHVMDGDRLDAGVHPFGGDHARQALGEVAEHLERR